MTLKNFEYPLIDALRFSFTKTRNIMLKLPKTIDLKECIKEIAELFSETRTGEKELKIELIKIHRCS